MTSRDIYLLFSEHGRIIDNIDHRSHYFRLVKKETGDFALLVEHGGGREEILGWFLRKLIIPLNSLDSDNRYRLLYAVFQSNKEGKLDGRDRAASVYRHAFIEGRLKKRKMPRSSEVKVWIESRPLQYTNETK